MLIILDGLDKTGKTTLARELADLIGAEVRHCEKPYRHPLDEYQSDLDDYVPGIGKHVIYDRHCWGERVWPKIYERRTQYTDEMHLHTEMFLQSRGAQIVWCTAPPEDIIERLIADDDPLPPHELVRPAEDMFYETYNRSLLKRGTLLYDFESDDLPNAEEIVICAQGRELMVSNAPTRHWVGDPRPDILLVGDEPGTMIPEQAAVPFRPFGGTSGQYLMKVPQHVPGLTRVTLTNARDGHGENVPLRALRSFLGEVPVVALGGQARAALEAQGVPHGVVPHPQWVRRFHYSRLGSYGELIKTASGGLDMRGEANTW